ncbi:MAG: acyl-CoA dehydrogenase family protein [Saprospiraceae bacterium]
MDNKLFTEEHELFRQSLRAFIEKEIQPNIDQWEEDRRIPRDIWKKMGDMGFLGLAYPEEYGGKGLDFFFDVVFNEELGRINSGGFIITQQVVQYMSGPYILKYGSEKLKQKYLPGIISGDLISSIGITEPGAGSDAQNIQTKAIKNGDHYIVNGSKTFITNGVYGDFIVTVVKTNPDAGAAGISLLVIDRNAKGVSAHKLKKLGWHASDTAELHFDNVAVPVENLIGQEGFGFYYLMNGLQLERLCFIPASVVAMECAINKSLQYMSERQAFGRPINRLQVLRHRIAQLASEIEALKAFSYYCCKMYNEGIYDVKLCSMAKLVCTELQEKVATQCLQFYGGYGFMEEYPMARMYRDSRVGTIGGGSSEIMREIIAKMVIDAVDYKKAETSFTYATDGNANISYFKEEHNLFRQTLRDFLNKEVRPYIDHWEKAGEIPKSIYRKFGEMGLFGLDISEKYGGTKNDIWHTVILQEEMSRINSGGFAAAIGAHFGLAMTHINAEGSDEQKLKYLIPGIKGELIGCLAITEPFGGSDVQAIKTTAVREGEYYLINGSKTFITNGVNSDYIVAAVKTNSESKANGISMIIIDRHQPGVSANKLNKLGWHASDTGEIAFDNVKVPVGNLLGEENKGFFYIMQHFVSERLSMAVGAVATSQYALETTLKYMEEREAFGRKINKFQVLRHRISQMVSEIELNKQFVYSLYDKYANGEYLVKEASMAKLVCTQLCDKVTFECLQMFGGYGYMEDYPLARMWRDARLGQIGGGTSEILCEIISKILIDGKGYDEPVEKSKKQTVKKIIQIK